MKQPCKVDVSCPQLYRRNLRVACMSWVICWIISHPNSVPLNNESIYFVHELAVWPGLGGNDPLVIIWDSSKPGNSELSEISLIHVFGGWGHLSTENLAGDVSEHSMVPLHGLWASSQHGGWVPKEDTESQAESVSPLMTVSRVTYCDSLLFI